jgi:hypothetical protein
VLRRAGFGYGSGVTQRSQALAAVAVLVAWATVADAQSPSAPSPGPAPGGLDIGAGQAEPRAPAAQPGGRPTVRPPRIESPPTIDGRLDDEAWKTAAKLTAFVQQRPLDGAPASEQTKVYVAYDSQAIYFGFYAHYTDPSIMRAQPGRPRPRLRGRLDDRLFRHVP